MLLTFFYNSKSFKPNGSINLFGELLFLNTTFSYYCRQQICFLLKAMAIAKKKQASTILISFFVHLNYSKIIFLILNNLEKLNQSFFKFLGREFLAPPKAPIEVL